MSLISCEADIVIDKYHLEKGDVLLYRGETFYNWLIRTKTWSDVDHSETYIGAGESAASRNIGGVGTYPIRIRGLKYILKPKSPIPSFEDGLSWHLSCIGQGYDLWGVIESFTNLGLGAQTKQWCSEHSARFAKKSGYYPFGPSFPSEKVSPGMFLASPLYVVIPVDPDDVA